MNLLRRLRAVARIELRDLARAKLRSMLVVVLIAIPVAAVVGASIVLHVTLPTSGERAANRLGDADLRIDSEIDAVADLLPPDARIERYAMRPERIEVSGLQLAGLRSEYGDDGLAAPRLRLVSGRAPRGDHEVALARVLADSAKARCGDRATLGSDGRVVEIVGIVVDPEDLDRPVVACAVSSALSTSLAHWLVDLPADSDSRVLAKRLRDRGARVMTAHEAADLSGPVAQAVFLFGALGFVEAALVIAAAFAVGLRRRQREVGLLAATGANRSDIVGSVLISAAMLATCGSALGVGVGTGIAALLHPNFDTWTGRLTGPFEMPPIPLVAAFSLGIVTAVLAATWPARTAARLPVRTALSGRRPVIGSARSWLFVGSLLVAIGFGLTFVSPQIEGALAATAGLGGAVLGVLGFGACSPWVLEKLGAIASRLPLAWRLAVRDAGRFKSRNGPVVTAVLAGMAVSVTIAATLSSLRGSSATSWVRLRDDQIRIDGPAAAEVSARIARDPSARARAPLAAAMSDSVNVRARFAGEVERRWVAVADPRLLEALGVDAPITGSSPLIAIGSRSDGRTVELLRGTNVLARLPAQDVEIGSRTQSPGFVISRDDLERLGLRVGAPPRRTSEAWLVRFEKPVDDSLLERARGIAADFPGTAVDARLLHRRTPRILYRIALAISIASGLLVIAVATALTAVESYADRITLVTVGAPPRVSRAHAAAGAGFLALLGCVLAVPAGLLPAFSVVTAIGELTFRVPWSEIAITALGLPAVAYAAAWCLTRPAAWRRSC